MDTQDKEPLYLEDLQVGQTFTSRSLVVDAEEIKRFAKAFDPQPFHLDEEAAARTMFGGLVASGWQTAALTMRLIVQDGPPIAGGIIGAGGELTWPRPTRPGDELHVVGEIVKITPSRSKPDRGMVVTRMETRNQRGEAVQMMTTKLVVPRRASSKGERAGEERG